MSPTPRLTYDELAEAYTQLQTDFEQFKHTQSDLLRATIHELRTPLTAILGFFSLIDASLTAEKMNTYIPPILQEGERLARVITDLHFQNELDSGRMIFNLTATAVELLLDQAIQECQHRSPDRDILKRASRTLPPVLIDRERAGAVLDILMRTVTRFSPEGTPINLIAEQQKASVALTIGSAGLGLPPQYREAVFAKYIRLPLSGGRTRLTLGLGLYAAREMARRMSAEVELLETEESGTAFLLRLPIAAQTD